MSKSWSLLWKEKLKAVETNSDPQLIRLRMPSKQEKK